MIRRADRSGDAVNLHATAFVLGDRGILVSGPSGAGKSLLALTMVAQARAAGVHARLVADDRVLAEVRHGRLIVRVPESIEGLAEARGFGPAAEEHEPAAIIDLEVEMTAGGGTDRYQAGNTVSRLGIEVPLLRLDIGELAGATLAIHAALRRP